MIISFLSRFWIFSLLALPALSAKDPPKTTSKVGAPKSTTQKEGSQASSRESGSSESSSDSPDLSDSSAKKLVSQVKSADTPYLYNEFLVSQSCPFKSSEDPSTSLSKNAAKLKAAIESACEGAFDPTYAPSYSWDTGVYNFDEDASIFAGTENLPTSDTMASLQGNITEFTSWAGASSSCWASKPAIKRQFLSFQMQALSAVAFNPNSITGALGTSLIQLASSAISLLAPTPIENLAKLYSSQEEKEFFTNLECAVYNIKDAHLQCQDVADKMLTNLIACHKEDAHTHHLKEIQKIEEPIRSISLQLVKNLQPLSKDGLPEFVRASRTLNFFESKKDELKNSLSTLEDLQSISTKAGEIDKLTASGLFSESEISFLKEIEKNDTVKKTFGLLSTLKDLDKLKKDGKWIIDDEKAKMINEMIPIVFYPDTDGETKGIFTKPSLSTLVVLAQKIKLADENLSDQEASEAYTVFRTVGFLEEQKLASALSKELFNNEVSGQTDIDKLYTDIEHVFRPMLRSKLKDQYKGLSETLQSKRDSDPETIWKDHLLPIMRNCSQLGDSFLSPKRKIHNALDDVKETDPDFAKLCQDFYCGSASDIEHSVGFVKPTPKNPQEGACFNRYFSDGITERMRNAFVFPATNPESNDQKDDNEDNVLKTKTQKPRKAVMNAKICGKPLSDLSGLKGIFK